MPKIAEAGTFLDYDCTVTHAQTSHSFCNCARGRTTKNYIPSRLNTAGPCSLAFLGAEGLKI